MPQRRAPPRRESLARSETKVRCQPLQLGCARLQTGWSPELKSRLRQPGAESTATPLPIAWLGVSALAGWVPGRLGIQPAEQDAITLVI